MPSAVSVVVMAELVEDVLEQMSDPVQLVSLVGAVMQLVAYALMQLGRLPSESYPYQLANVIGSFMMTVVATINHEYGFSGYAFFIECLEGMHQQGIVMTEAPIDFLDRQGGVSKIPKNQIVVSAGALGQMSWARLTNRGRRT
jgi:hypothetical protein